MNMTETLFQVYHQDLSPFQALKKSLNSIFTSEFVDKLLEYHNFIEVDGKMYACCHGRGSDIYYIDCKFAVTDVEEDEIEFTVTARYIKDEYLDYMYDDSASIKDSMIEVRDIKFELKNYNGKWLFDNFELWY